MHNAGQALKFSNLTAKERLEYEQLYAQRLAKLNAGMERGQSSDAVASHYKVKFEEASMRIIQM